jgi:hypothetical protein
MTTVVKKRPLRGMIAGLLIGLGAALMLVLFDVNVSGDLVLAAALVLGLLWGLFGPTRKPRGTSLDQGEGT